MKRVISNTMGKKFQIPEGFFNQLNEFSSGGYLILTFDTDGNPRLRCQFDTAVHAMGAQKYLTQWLDALDENQREKFLNAMSPMDDDDEAAA